MLSRATLIELAREAVNDGDLDKFQEITGQLEKRLQYPTMSGVVAIEEYELEELELPTLLRMLISASELVGEVSLGREAVGTAHDNQDVLLKTIKGRYHDLETKLQQINEISGNGCDPCDGYQGEPDHGSSGTANPDTGD